MKVCKIFIFFIDLCFCMLVALVVAALVSMQ
jgi:hypothetical protein